jgi:hypothetical protein
VKRGSVAVGFLDPGHWSHCFGQSLIDLYLTDAFGSKRLVPHGMQLRDNCQAGGIVAGRNDIARKFLDDTECEWLFMVDSDMGFSPDTVDRLIASADPVRRPVVGGLCFALRRETAGDCYGQKYVVVPTCYELVQSDAEVGFRSILDYPRDSLMQVSGTGAACLMIHRTALHRVRGKYGDKWFDPITHPVGPTTFSEDLSFCVRLAAIDLPVFVDTSVRTTHDKHGVFLDELEFDRSVALHDLERVIREQQEEVA